MILTSNHIDPLYSNVNLKIKTRLVQFASWLFAAFKRRFNFKSGIVKRLHEDYSKIYLMTEGLKAHITELRPDQYMQAYERLTESFNKFRTLNHLLQKIQYVGNSSLQTTIEATLDNFYELEFELRKKAFADVTSDPQDEELKTIATSLSLNSVHSNYAPSLPTT